MDELALRKALYKIRLEKARQGLLSFTRWTFPGYRVHWHHRVIADYLDRVAHGEIKRLMVFCPPGHGKSELSSRRFPAWLLGRDPTTRIMFTTYAATLAEDMGRDVQRIMSEPEYVNTFGDVLAGKRTALHFETEQEESFHRPGYYLGVGVRGSLTGRRFDAAIIDDPVKGREEAESPTIRDKLWKWYQDDLLTRASGPDASIVLIQTRWHEDDLAGRLLQDAADGGEQWTVVRLPAIRDEDNPYPVPVEDVDHRPPGEPLWDAVAPKATLDHAKRTPRKWTSLFQQRPTPAEGGLFKRHWFRYYTQLQPGVYQYHAHGDLRTIRLQDLTRFCTVDLAASTREAADYTVIATWGLAPDGHLLLLGVVREHMEGPDHIPSIKAAMERWGAGVAWIESAAFQLTTVQHARRAGLPVRELKADKDKLSRALPATAYMEGGQVVFPTSSHWLADWEAELLTFAPGCAHDDQVDNLAYAVRVALEVGGHAPAPPTVGDDWEDSLDQDLLALPADPWSR